MLYCETSCMTKILERRHKQAMRTSGGADAHESHRNRSGDRRPRGRVDAWALRLRGSAVRAGLRIARDRRWRPDKSRPLVNPPLQHAYPGLSRIALGPAREE